MMRRVLPVAFVVATQGLALPVLAQTAPATLSGDAMAIACAPRASFEAPAATMKVGGSLTHAKGVFAPWHRLVVDAGTEEGVKRGQDYYVRRVVPPREPPARGAKTVHAIMTIGWLRIDEAQSHRSIASVLHECDGVAPGDFLEPFAVPAVPTPLPPGTADYSQSARVLFGGERSTIAGGGAMVVIDLGSKQGLRPGQRVTIYRPSTTGPNVIVSGGVAMLVESDTSTIRVQDMRDAVMAGDSVAPHK